MHFWTVYLSSIVAAVAMDSNGQTNQQGLVYSCDDPPTQEGVQSLNPCKVLFCNKQLASKILGQIQFLVK